MGNQPLPISDVTREQIEQAKSLLGKQCLGISYADVLRSVVAMPWSVSGFADVGNLDLTRKLLELSPVLGSQFRMLTSSEGGLARVFSVLPVVGRRLQSEIFLESSVEVNKLIPEMQQVGLITLANKAVTVTANAGRFGLLSPHVHRFSIILASDLGKLALEADEGASTGNAH